MNDVSPRRVWWLPRGGGIPLTARPVEGNMPGVTQSNAVLCYRAPASMLACFV